MELTTRQSKLIFVEMVYGALFPAEFFIIIAVSPTPQPQPQPHNMAIFSLY